MVSMQNMTNYHQILPLIYSSDKNPESGHTKLPSLTPFWSFVISASVCLFKAEFLSIYFTAIQVKQQLVLLASICISFFF